MHPGLDKALGPPGLAHIADLVEAVFKQLKASLLEHAYRQ
jgi:hypothetical protein